MYGENIKTIETAGSVRAVSAGFLKGIIIAAVFTAIAFMACALILAYTSVPESAIPFVSIVVELLGALISGYCTAKRSGVRGFLSGLLAGICYILIIWLIALLAAEGLVNVKHFLMMLGLSALSGAVGGVLGVNLRSGKSNRRR